MTVIITLAIAFALSSCATERPARAAGLDPANPAAPEAPTHATFTPLGTVPTAPASPQSGSVEVPAPKPADTKHGHDHGAAKEESPKGEMAYTCPMHPEVVSSKPGKCPKCGMKLVPKTAESKPEKAK